jgi:hypothetical protein
MQSLNTDRTTLPEIAASALGNPTADRDLTNSSRVAQSIRANQARNRSGRRRLVDPTTCDRDYSAAEMEFMQAMTEYKKTSGRMFPTWSEVLEVLRDLGYERPTSGALSQGERPA